ncbi:chromate resistance protein ChrB domain-containing protein [Planctomyces sp. SH-PL14]|uniref:chromate resistance protein ChrB domain-containing protein n=1 Tax=Planctomyces sp. SH-PL14 TaxID=1632864 RepID=UPI00078E5B1E|nr:chromate resistance protein ChrB domain-containing protein [Planctomyces sp. SH-PL14]AMV20160.1 Chromate resistance exported protein [Planctomyces sp. SH-PL14]
MQWVTWENVGVDRIGCAWLILREIDPKAKFVFIPRGAAWAADAQPFDIPGVRFSHHGGHCSFHALVHEHKLSDPTLHRIARIIDEADTVQPVNIERVAPGLDLLCEGLRRISPDDATALERGRLLYDALYSMLAEKGSAS